MPIYSEDALELLDIVRPREEGQILAKSAAPCYRVNGIQEPHFMMAATDVQQNANGFFNLQVGRYIKPKIEDGTSLIERLVPLDS